jgi:hypothetical protein
MDKEDFHGKKIQLVSISCQEEQAFRSRELYHVSFMVWQDGTNPEDIIRNAFACSHEEPLGLLPKLS